MFIGLPMCFNMGSVDATHKVQAKDYMLPRWWLCSCQKGWIHLKHYFLKCFVNLLVRNIQMEYPGNETPKADSLTGFWRCLAYYTDWFFYFFYYFFKLFTCGCHKWRHSSIMSQSKGGLWDLINVVTRQKKMTMKDTFCLSGGLQIVTCVTSELQMQ